MAGLNDSLTALMGIDGAQAVALVDYESGMLLGEAGAVTGIVIFDAEGGKRGGGGHRRCLTSRKTPPYPVEPLSILPVRPILYDR